ncbi:unnamed protein product, partial [Ectocarpus sp. 4 AP-2014]
RRDVSNTTIVGIGEAWLWSYRLRNIGQGGCHLSTSCGTAVSENLRMFRLLYKEEPNCPVLQNDTFARLSGGDFELNPHATRPEGRPLLIPSLLPYIYAIFSCGQRASTAV